MRGIDTIDLHIAVLIIVNISITWDRNRGGAGAIIGYTDHHQGIGVFFAVIDTCVKVAQLLFGELVALSIGARVRAYEEDIDSAIDIISRALAAISVTAQVQVGSRGHAATKTSDGEITNAGNQQHDDRQNCN